MLDDVLNEIGASPIVQNFLQKEKTRREGRMSRSPTTYLIENSWLRIIIVIVRFVTRSHAGFECCVFEVFVAIRDFGSVERISIIVWTTSYTNIREIRTHRSAELVVTEIMSNLHRAIALISAHFDVLVRFRIVHRDLKIIRSNAMNVRVAIGEETTLNHRQALGNVPNEDLNRYL